MRTGGMRWAAVCGAAVVTGGAARGAEETAAKPATEMPEYVVTANREATPVSRVAANAIALTGEQIRQAGYLTLVEGLEQLAGVHVRSVTANPTAAEVSLRGFGENSHGRVLVLLNGRRLNRPDMATINWMQIPLNQIERVEVVRGAASALYGDHAVGGVINIVTKSGQAKPTADVAVDAASHGTTVLRAGAAGTSGRLSGAANVERFESQGYRDRSAFLSWGVGGSLGLPLGEDGKVTLDAGWQRVDNELPGWLTKADAKAHPRRSTNPDDDVGSEYLHADGGLDLAIGANQRLVASLGFGRKEIETDMVSWGIFSDMTVDSAALSPRYSVETPIAGHGNRAAIGVDLSEDTLNLDRYDAAARQNRIGDARVRRQAFGGYVRDEFDVRPDLVLAAGARTESARVDAEVSSGGARAVDEALTHQASAVDVSALKQFKRDGKVFARFGTLYRYPFVDEQVSYQGWGDAFLKDLDPERGWSAEIGGRGTPAEGLTAGLTAFYSEMTDEIGYNPVTYRNENLDETRRQGAEADAAYRCRLGSVQAAYTYTEARFASGANEGNDVPLVPRHRVSLGARIPLPAGLRFDATGRYVGESFLGGDNANAGDKLSDHVVLDVFLRYVSAAVPGLEAYVGAENVLDEPYCAYAFSAGGWGPDGYYPSAGTTFRAGVFHRF